MANATIDALYAGSRLYSQKVTYIHQTVMQLFNLNLFISMLFPKHVDTITTLQVIYDSDVRYILKSITFNNCKIC